MLQKQSQKKFSIHTFFLRSQHIAFYLPVNGELNPLPILERAWEMKKNCYLPVLHPLKHNRLYFAAYYPGDELIANYYGILEPKLKSRRLIPAWALDLVFLPLVGFDKNKNRLGMGGGFYDRSFAFRKEKNLPLLIGLAYQFQQINNLSPAPWDVTLEQVLTE